tara:strand:+ start:114 stop:515 length:402 start_codon:yes stop_codon:yes gene_type:complete
MSLEEILTSHNITRLRSEVKAANIIGFATMKKDALIKEMLKRPHSLWKHIKPSGRKGRVSYDGAKRKTTKKSIAADKKALAELKSTKAGRLAIIEDKIRRLPANASKGRIEALRAQLRAEKKSKAKINMTFFG